MPNKFVSLGCLTSLFHRTHHARMEHRSEAGRLSTSSPENRVLDVLECFGPHERELPLSDIAARTNLAKSTVHRLLTGLVARGYVANFGQGNYGLGPMPWEIGCRWIAGVDVVAQARPHMDRLCDAFGQSVYVAVLSGSDVVYVASAIGRSSVIMHTELGSRAPAYATASGKAILAFSPPAVVDTVVGGGLPALTPRTVTDPEAFRTLLADVRQRGYALNYGERYPDLMGVAAPLRDYTGRARAAITMGGSVARLTRHLLVHKAAPDVAAAAGEISTLLGFIRPPEGSVADGKAQTPSQLRARACQ